jgi:hypothetical protein
MSLRFGSGWLVIYFLICSCTFKCSAPQLRARDYTTFNPFEPLEYMHPKPSSHSGRIVGNPYLGIISGLPVIHQQWAAGANRSQKGSLDNRT